MHRSNDATKRSRSPSEGASEIRDRSPLGREEPELPIPGHEKRDRKPTTVPFQPQDTTSSSSSPDINKLALSSGSQDSSSSSSPDTKKSSMPYFLQLTDHDIGRKFNDLTAKELRRIEEAVGDPTSQWAVMNTPECILLDRYLNIQPWARNRVKLRVPDDKNNYVNASPISLQQLDNKATHNYKYIAMQGPKQITVSHTWRMIWEQVESPAVIVMLTDIEEGGKEKCCQYFPKDADSEPLVINEPDEFGDGFKATLSFSETEKTEQGDAIEVRKLIMRVESPVKGDSEKGEEDTVKVEEKIIWHLLYTRWPDFGVPEVSEVDSFFALMELSRAKNTVPENPRIVHCSAGVGRSGTFIALEYLMAELEAGGIVYHGNRDIPTSKLKGPEPYLLRGPPPVFLLNSLTPPGTNRTSSVRPKDLRKSPSFSPSGARHAAITSGEKDLVFETVDRLRQQRKTMVQSDSQYLFIYRVLKRCWEAKYNNGIAITPPATTESQNPFED